MIRRTLFAASVALSLLAGCAGGGGGYGGGYGFNRFRLIEAEPQDVARQTADFVKRCARVRAQHSATAT